MKIATCQLYIWDQNDLPLGKGYKEGTNFLHDFFGAI